MKKSIDWTDDFIREFVPVDGERLDLFIAAIQFDTQADFAKKLIRLKADLYAMLNTCTDGRTCQQIREALAQAEQVEE